jgi:hypothetical protein
VVHVLAVTFGVAIELRERQIVRIERKEAEPTKDSGEHLAEPVLVAVRAGAHRDVIQVDSVRFVKRGPTARERHQVDNQRPWPHFNHVDVGSRARQAVL